MNSLARESFLRAIRYIRNGREAEGFKSMLDLDRMQDGFELPAIMDTQAAAAVLEKFLAHRGGDLRIGGADVQRIGGQCLQVLLAARTAWAADGNSLSIADMSPEFTAALETLGASENAITFQKDFAS
jgi:chemotaxis protein CheX